MQQKPSTPQGQPQVGFSSPAWFSHTPQRHPSISPFQAKLTVGEPGDRYEQEADRVAEQVMSMAPPTPPNLQHQAKEDELQTKPLAETITPIVQRQEEQEAPSAKILNSVMVGQVMCQSIPPLETDHPLTLPTPVTLTLTSPTQRFSLLSPSQQRFPRLSLFPTSQHSFPDLGLSPGRLNLPTLDSPNLSPLSPLERESPLDQDLLSADTEPEDAQFSSDETGVELSRGGHVDSERGASSVYAELTIQIPESRFPLLQQDDLQLNLDILNQMAARVELSGGTGGGLAISREMTLDLFRLTLQEGDNSYQTFEAIVQFISQTDGSTVGGTIRYRPWQELAIEAGGQVDIGEATGSFSGGIGVTPVNGLEIIMRGNFTASDSEVQIDSVSLQITISPSLGESSSTSSGQRLQESDAEDSDLATETEATTAPPIQRAATNLPQIHPDLESRLSASQSSGSTLPDEVRSFMEPRFGTDFSQVRVHTDSEAVQMNQELRAQAFTHRNHIYYGAGKAPAKDELTGHELTHVVQQTGTNQIRGRADGVPDRAEWRYRGRQLQIRRSPEEGWTNSDEAPIFGRYDRLQQAEETETEAGEATTPTIQRKTDDLRESPMKPLVETITPFSAKGFQAETLQRSVEYRSGRPVRAVENFTVSSNHSEFERQVIAWIGHLVERERAPHLVHSSVTFSELQSRLQAGDSVEITADLIWNQRQVVEVRFSIPTVDFRGEDERVEGVPWRHLRDSYTREIVRQLHTSPLEIYRNTAQRIIDDDVTLMYFDELTRVRNEAEELESMGYIPPANYRLYWHPDPQSSGQTYFHTGSRPADAMRIPSSSIIVISRSTPISDVFLSHVVHEVNHAVNRLATDQYDPNTQPQDYLFAFFRSEFRAYWVSDIAAQRITNLDERARQIKEYILANHSDIREAYDANEVLRRRIDAHTRPDGNLTNG